MSLTDYDANTIILDYDYTPKDSILNLKFNTNNVLYELNTKALDWRSLAVLKNNFHWSIEQIE